MVLRGALGDFGIANIFSLVGSQARSGTLQVFGGDEHASLFFVRGAVVQTDATQHQELLGDMLLRAEAITVAQLDTALQQSRGNRRGIGEHLVRAGALPLAELQAFALLHSCETIFRLLTWRTGCYEFTAGAAPATAVHAPCRAETLLMDGLQQADMWPALRQQLPNYGLSFATHGELPAAPHVADAASLTDELDLAMTLAELPAAAAPARRRAPTLGQHERRLFALVQPQRDVHKLIGLSRLGEFATCRALCSLLDLGLVRPLPPQFAPPRRGG